MRKEAFFSIILILLLNSPCFPESIQIPICSPPAELEVDPFYTKYLDCDGIPVMGSDRVDDRAFYRLQELLDNVLVNRPDLRQAMAAEGFRCIIIAEEEQVTDVPEYANMKPKDYWNQRARGFGGDTTSCGEENLLNLPLDRYGPENIFVHEFAHSIHLLGLRKYEPDFQAKLDTLYKQAMEKGLYKNDYAATNASEYWAESIQAFFDCDRQNDNAHNHVNTREELIVYDPNIVSLICETLRIKVDDGWRYKPYSQEMSVEQTPPQLNANGILIKYIWCLGLPVLGTESAADEHLIAAATTIRGIFKDRYDILKAMIDADACVVICEKDIDLSGFEQSYIVVRLSEGEVAENNHSTLVSGLVRVACQVAGMRPIDCDKQPVSAKVSRKDRFLDVRFDQRAKQLYEAAIQKELWLSSPAAENRFEYVAYGAVAFFNAGTIKVIGDQTIGNREQLIDYDPELANLLTDIFLPSRRGN